MAIKLMPRLNSAKRGGPQKGAKWQLIALGLSGVAMGLATAPKNLWGLAWLALAPLWFWAIAGPPLWSSVVPALPSTSSPTKPTGKFLAFKLVLSGGLIWGAGFHGTALAWITGIHPMTWMGVPWLASLAIAAFCWGFITLWGAALVTFWTFGMAAYTRMLDILQPSTSKPISVFHRRALSLGRILFGAALWCSLEGLWSSGALWWSSLSLTQSPGNLVVLHLARLAGPSAVTAAIVSVNGLIAELWQITSPNVQLDRPRSEGQAVNPANIDHQTDGLLPEKPIRLRMRQLAAIVTIPLVWLLVLHGIGFWLYAQPLAEDPALALQVGIVQGNIPNTIKLYDEGWRRAIAGYTQGYVTLARRGVDVVLTPETALPWIWRGADGEQSDFYQAIKAEGTPVWLGTFGTTATGLTNSLLAIAADGNTLSRYDKVKLVPLGEYIPLGNLLGQVIKRLSPLDAQLRPGNRNQQFQTGFGPAIVSICYESAFSNYLRAQAQQGGALFLSAANNAHYSAAMPAQHHAQDVLRAIELDRWAIRATNTGFSGVVNPHGKTQWRSNLNTYAIYSQKVYRRQTKTPYVKWGDQLTPILWVATMGCSLLLRQTSNLG